MDVLLHTHGGHARLRVPDGLPQLVHDIGREVLRKQPTSLYSFIADYLDTLVAMQESSRALRDMLSDFFAELGGGGETSPGSSSPGRGGVSPGPGGELDQQQGLLAVEPDPQPHPARRTQSLCERAEERAERPQSPPSEPGSALVWRRPRDVISASAHDLTGTDERGAVLPRTALELTVSSAVTASPSLSEPKLRSALTKRPETHGRGAARSWASCHGLDELLDTPRQYDKEGAVPKTLLAPELTVNLAELPAELAELAPRDLPSTRAGEDDGREDGVEDHRESGGMSVIDRNIQEIDEMGAQISSMLAMNRLDALLLPPCLGLTDAVLDMDDDLLDFRDDDDDESGSDDSDNTLVGVDSPRSPSSPGSPRSPRSSRSPRSPGSPRPVTPDSPDHSATFTNDVCFIDSMPIETEDDFGEGLRGFPDLCSESNMLLDAANGTRCEEQRDSFGLTNRLAVSDNE